MIGAALVTQRVVGNLSKRLRQGFTVEGILTVVH